MTQASPRARVADFEPPEWPEEPAPVAVRPVLFGHPSISRASAKRILADPANAFRVEAQRVLEIGEHWIWT